jgi:hypothetical protein
MQMITEVGAAQNTMTIVMMPSEFVAMARSIADAAKDRCRQGVITHGSSRVTR